MIAPRPRWAQSNEDVPLVASPLLGKWRPRQVALGGGRADDDGNDTVPPSAPLSAPDHNGSGPGQQQQAPPPPPLGLGGFLSRELSWGGGLGWSRPAGNAPASETVVNFLLVPYLFERFASFGHAVCADLFLHHFTLLPLRCAQAVVALAASALCALRGGGGKSARPALTRAAVYDLLKGAIIVLATVTLGYVQVSRVYHYIRGEAVIKLYVVYNVLSMGDALLASLGQDIMDALYRTTRDALGGGDSDSDVSGGGDAPVKPGAAASGTRWRALPSWLPAGAQLLAQLLVAVVYVSVHAGIIFVQIVCLNVAMNSRNNALLTLLVSNNFVELKGSVFKKYEPENLFQVACADAVERFTLSLYLVLIGLTELVSLSSLATLGPSIAVIWAAELGVDYAKHAFVSKFNRLHADLYGSFSAILAHDALAVRGRYDRSLDPTHAPVRRLGLAALPLSCVVVRMAIAKIPPVWRPRLSSPSGLAVWALLGCVLYAAKVALNMAVLGHAARVVTEQRASLAVSGAAAAAAAAAAATTGAGTARSHREGERVGTGGGVGAGRRPPEPPPPPGSDRGDSRASNRGDDDDDDKDDAADDGALVLERVSRTERYTMRGKGIPM